MADPTNQRLSVSLNVGYNSNSSRKEPLKKKETFEIEDNSLFIGDSEEEDFVDCLEDTIDGDNTFGLSQRAPPSPLSQHRRFHRNSRTIPVVDSLQSSVETLPSTPSTKKTHDTASEAFYQQGFQCMIGSGLCLGVAFQRTWSLSFPWRVASGAMSLFFVFLANSYGVMGRQITTKTHLTESLPELGLTDSLNLNSKTTESVKPNQPVGIVQQGSNLCFFNVFLQTVMHVKPLQAAVKMQCQAAEGHLKNFVDGYQILFPAKIGKGLLNRSRDLHLNLSKEQVTSILLILCQKIDFAKQLEESNQELIDSLNKFKTAVDREQPLPVLSEDDLQKIGETFLLLRQSDQKISNPWNLKTVAGFFSNLLRVFQKKSTENVGYNNKIRKLLEGYKTDVEHERKAFQTLNLCIDKYEEAKGKHSINLSGSWLGSELAPIRYFFEKNPKESQEDPAELFHRIFITNFGVKSSVFQIKKEETRIFKRVDIPVELDKSRNKDYSPFPKNGVQVSPGHENTLDILTLHPANGSNGQKMINNLVREQKYTKNSQEYVRFVDDQNKVNSYCIDSITSKFLELPKCLQIKIERFQEGKKTTALVGMPDELTIGQHRYRKAVAIEHYGEEWTRGSYVAHIIQGQDRWFVNDLHVSSDDLIPDTNRKEDNYYLYFYERISKQPV